MNVSKVLKGIIKASGKSKTDLAVELKVGRAALYDWLSGKHEVRSELYLDRIKLVAKKYGVTVK